MKEPKPQKFAPVQRPLPRKASEWAQEGANGMQIGSGKNMTMDEIMREWPQAIPVIVRNRMLCVGCPIASFHTIAEAAREHGLDEVALRRDLQVVGVRVD